MAESEYDSEVEFNLNKNSEVPVAEEDIEHQPCDDTIIIDGIQEALEGSDEHGEYLQRDSGAKRPSQSGTVAIRHESSQSRGDSRADCESSNSMTAEARQASDK